MKKIVLVFLVLMLCVSVSVDAKIRAKKIGQELTSDKFIKISTVFIDDKNTISKADDEQVGAVDHRKWNPLRFEGKTKAERTAIIRADLQEKMDGNIIFWYLKDKAESPIVSIRKSKAQDIYDTFSDIKIEFEQSNLIKKMDLDGDNLCEKEWTINPDGTHTSISIAPQSCK